MSGIKLAAAALLATSLMTGNALAQSAGPAANGPIDITADSAEVQKAECKSVWRGNAEALQNSRRLRAGVITAVADKKGDSCGDTNRLEADGDVYFVTPEQVVRGDHAVYTQSSGVIVVTGNVVVVQGKNVARGDRMTIQVRGGSLQMESAAKGRGATGRVRGVFFPDSAPN